VALRVFGWAAGWLAAAQPGMAVPQETEEGWLWPRIPQPELSQCYWMIPEGRDVAMDLK